MGSCRMGLCPQGAFKATFAKQLGRRFFGFFDFVKLKWAVKDGRSLCKSWSVVANPFLRATFAQTFAQTFSPNRLSAASGRGSYHLLK